MNNKEIKWEIKEIAPGMVKIEANSLGRIPTFEEFKAKAKEVLNTEQPKATDKLKDEIMNPDLGDSLLLRSELNNMENVRKVQQVLFTYGNNTIMANSKTIDEIVEKKEITRTGVNEFGANPDITEQVLEDFER